MNNNRKLARNIGFVLVAIAGIMGMAYPAFPTQIPLVAAAAIAVIGVPLLIWGNKFTQHR